MPEVAVFVSGHSNAKMAEVFFLNAWLGSRRVADVLKNAGVKTLAQWHSVG